MILYEGTVMTWDAIGAIGEIISALAVVVTVSYLAIQVRRSGEQTKTQTVQSIFQPALLIFFFT